MAKQWTCARCSTKNDEGTLTCSNCRMIRGAVVVPGSFGARPPDAPEPGPTASPEPYPAPSPVWPGAADPEPSTEADVQPNILWAAGTAPTEQAPTRPLWRRIPIAGVLLALFAVAGGVGGLLFDASRSETGEIAREGDMMATDLQIGDCFDLKEPDAEEITDVTARPCAEEHQYELYHVGFMAEGAYPADEAFDAFFETSCLGVFATYVGTTYANSALDVFWLTPGEPAWDAGDRSIQCAAYDPANARLTGTIRASRR